MSLYGDNSYNKSIQDVYSNMNSKEDEIYTEASKIMEILVEARKKAKSDDIVNFDLVNKIWTKIEGTMMAEGLLTEENLEKIKELIVNLDKSLSELK